MSTARTLINDCILLIVFLACSLLIAWIKSCCCRRRFSVDYQIMAVNLAIYANNYLKLAIISRLFINVLSVCLLLLVFILFGSVFMVVFFGRCHCRLLIFDNRIVRHK